MILYPGLGPTENKELIAFLRPLLARPHHEHGPLDERWVPVNQEIVITPTPTPTLHMDIFDPDFTVPGNIDATSTDPIRFVLDKPHYGRRQIKRLTLLLTREDLAAALDPKMHKYLKPVEQVIFCQTDPR